MSEMPSPGQQMLATFAAFLVGPIAIVYLVDYQAPGSDLVVAVSGLLAGATFFFGFFAWLGGALLSLFTRGGREQARSGQPPKGTIGFVICAVVAGALSGFLTALAGEGFMTPLWTVFAGFFAYGYALHRLAKAGYLPFVDDAG